MKKVVMDKLVTKDFLKKLESKLISITSKNATTIQDYYSSEFDLETLLNKSEIHLVPIGDIIDREIRKFKKVTNNNINIIKLVFMELLLEFLIQEEIFNTTAWYKTSEYLDNEYLTVLVENLINSLTELNKYEKDYLEYIFKFNVYQLGKSIDAIKDYVNTKLKCNKDNSNRTDFEIRIYGYNLLNLLFLRLSKRDFC